MTENALFAVSIASHAGVVRSNNEDQLVVGSLISNGAAAPPMSLEVEGPILLAAIDGMGGHAGGEVAARIVAKTLSVAAPPAESQGLVELLHEANAAVYRAMAESPELLGMGATAVALVASDSRIIVGHVGDARAYAFKDGYASLVTEDHRSAASGRLTRSLGGFDAFHATEPSVHELDPAARVLLCTDGLTDVVGFSAIQSALAEPDGSVVASSLIEAAIAAGAPDNVSVVLTDRLSDRAPMPGMVSV